MCRDRSPLERAVDFHGHICPGLLIGLKAAQFAQQYLDIDQDEDEELLAIVENDSCGVDAIQAVLGCTFGKGNLIFRDWGKQVYTIARRDNARAVRIVLKSGAMDSAANRRFRELNSISVRSDAEETEREDMRSQVFEEMLSRSFEEMFDYREISLELPAKAVIESSVRCVVCGEEAKESKVVQSEQGPVCPACV